MNANDFIYLINRNQRVDKDLWIILDDFIIARTQTYFSRPLFLRPSTVMGWVTTFVRAVKADEITNIEGSIEEYFWNHKKRYLIKKCREQFNQTLR